MEATLGRYILISTPIQYDNDIVSRQTTASYLRESQVYIFEMKKDEITQGKLN